MLRFNTRSKRFRAGWIVGKSLILLPEEISRSSDPRLLLISRLKVRFLPRSPSIINNLQAHRERSRQAESVGLASCYMPISFRIRKILLRLLERCAVSFGASVDLDLSSYYVLYVYVVGGSVRSTPAVGVT